MGLLFLPMFSCGCIIVFSLLKCIFKFIGSHDKDGSVNSKCHIEELRKYAKKVSHSGVQK